jgi:hypothetical protein
MQLFEFFDAVDDSRYESTKDQTVYKLDDTRKSRLTLEMINSLRQQIQSKRLEKQSAQELYQKMYGGSVADAAESI